MCGGPALLQEHDNQYCPYECQAAGHEVRRARPDAEEQRARNRSDCVDAATDDLPERPNDLVRRLGHHRALHLDQPRRGKVIERHQQHQAEDVHLKNGRSG
eukprot:scaffold10736_cov70-Phaeocystis_antarctica.AAC.2